MRLQNRSQYAIRVLNHIASENRNQKSVKLFTAKDLAETLEIPYKFLTKIMLELSQAGFLTSVRGRDGGYHLSKEPCEIHLSEILDTFNESATEKACIMGAGLCDQQKQCPLHKQWAKPKEMIKKMFDETTLEMMMEEEST